MSVMSLSVSEAKATFSNLIQQVCEHDDAFIIKKRGKPVARIVPFASESTNRVAGSLAHYAQAGICEDGAFAEAMVMKHATNR